VNRTITNITTAGPKGFSGANMKSRPLTKVWMRTNIFSHTMSKTSSIESQKAVHGSPLKVAKTLSRIYIVLCTRRRIEP
ncbi:MAG: hypothetical protein OEM90_14715, partial [Desulfobacteraceae bacterium]|nr:hypothetical protein [Desulfobacteraceae bacterium]